MHATVTDLRSFIELLRQKRLVNEIAAPVDPVHEVGSILRAGEHSGKATFFHHVGTSRVPLVGSMLGSHERIALALGCRREELGEVLERATEAPLPSALTAGPAACQEVVIEHVDLAMFPIPTHAPNDAGPYINAGVVIARDPLGGRHNLSYVRFQVKGPDRIGVNLNHWRHLREFFEAAEALGSNLPLCIAIGTDPALMLAAAFRYDGDEYEIAGALRGVPTRVVKAMHSDIHVPADAEIILECEVLAGERESEGPMAEYTGHYSGVGMQPVARVLGVTHRRHPIFQTIAGASFEHLLLGTAVTREPRLKRLAQSTSPRVREVLLPPYASGFLALVSMDQPRPGEVRSVGIAALHSHVNITTVVVVDSDVDLFDPADVMWALSTRVRWDRDIVVIPGALGNELHPSSDAHGVTCKIIVDATLAVELRQRFSKVVYGGVDLAALLQHPLRDDAADSSQPGSDA